MNFKNNCLANISDDYLIRRSRNGIVLQQPHHFVSSENSNQKAYSVKDLMDLPICFYFLNTQSELQKINVATVNACGFISENDALSRTMFDIAHKQSALEVIQADKYVMSTNRMEIRENIVTRKDGVTNNCLSIKLPWYNDNNKIVGIFGCTLVQGQQSLANFLSLVSQLGMLLPNQSHSFQGDEINNIHLTKREIECLRLVIRGKSAKEISIVLGVSNRTVEHRIEDIKSKFQAAKKSELIDKAIDYFDTVQNSNCIN